MSGNERAPKVYPDYNKTHGGYFKMAENFKFWNIEWNHYIKVAEMENICQISIKNVKSSIKFN